MAELTVRVGQWSVPNGEGRPTTATAYAGFSSYHLAAVSDGALGPVPTVVAAQAAVSALLGGFRRRPHSATPERIAAGFKEAHAAVKRTAVGTHAEGQAGAELAAVVIEAERLWVGLLGGGRAWVIRDEEAVEVGAAAASGYAGDGVGEPSLAALAMVLNRGDRVVLATGATARTLAADLGALARGSSPQLIAQALVDRARSRGAVEALTLQVLEVQSDSTARPGRADLHETGTASAEWAARRRRHWLASLWRLLLVGLTGAVLGALAAWLHAPRPQAPPPVAEAARPADAASSASADAAAALSDDAAVTDALAQYDAAASEAGPGAPVDEAEQAAAEDPAESPPALSDEEAAGLAALFKDPDPRRAARKLARHLRLARHHDMDSTLQAVSVWVRDHRSPQIIEILVHLVDQRPRAKVRRWARELLPTLYEPVPED